MKKHLILIIFIQFLFFSAVFAQTDADIANQPSFGKVATPNFSLLRQDTIDAKIMSNSPVDSIFGYSQIFSPFRNCFCVTVIGQKMISSGVSGLFFARFPLNISFLVISIIINAVKAVFIGRSFTNFVKKFFKRIEIEFYSAPPVFIKTFVIWVLAATLCGIINFIFFCKRLSVLGKFRRTLFLHITTARTNYTVLQTRSANHLDYSAFALTEPVGFFSLNSGISQYLQIAKLFIAQIYKVFVGWKRLDKFVNINFRHSVFSYIENVLVRVAESLRNFWRPVSILTQKQIKCTALTTLFIALTALNSFSQNEPKNENDVNLQRLDKTLDLLEKRDQEIIDLKKLVKTLEESKLTPCVIAINSFTESYLKLPMPATDNSKAENKEIIKLRKKISDIWKKAIQGQCGFTELNKWKSLADFSIKLVGIGLLVAK